MGKVTTVRIKHKSDSDMQIMVINESDVSEYADWEVIPERNVIMEKTSVDVTGQEDEEDEDEDEEPEASVSLDDFSANQNTAIPVDVTAADTHEKQDEEETNTDHNVDLDDIQS